MTKHFPLLAVFVLAGCVATHATLIEPSVRRPPVCPEGVQLFLAWDRVTSGYRDVAIIYSNGDTHLTNTDDMIKAEIKKAAKLGANGLVLGRIRGPNGATQVAAALTNSSTEREGRAFAIWIPADSARTDSTCARMAETRR